MTSAESAADNVRDWLSAATIDDDVRRLRPDYAALLVVAEGLRPGPSDAVSDALLTAGEDRARAWLAGRDPAELDHVGRWREAYQAFGAKPKRTKPSVEALLRRLDAGLPRVDRVTDTYNAVSIAHLLPIGGEDLDAYRGPARLVRATGTETFDTVSNGEQVEECAAVGEVVWCDDRGVTCRRWNWRQCVRTRITATTRRVVFILDGLSALGIEGLRSAGDELVTSVGRLGPEVTFHTRLLD